MIRGVPLRLALATALIGVSGCGLDLLSPETRGALVPPTVDEDLLLPQLQVTVAGHDRKLHLRSFGDPADPVALLLPGGPGADFRLLLPLQTLAERYYVVMWDPRGTGLSERVTREELHPRRLGHALFGRRPRQAIGEIIGGEFDMVLGRRTYEIFAAYWPYQGDNPIAKAFNKARKYVVTRSLDQLDWEASQQVGGHVVEEVRRLKESDGPTLHIWGSGELLQTLIGADLIDEYRIWIFPLVLGEGKRLFEDGVPPRGFTLVETGSTPEGVLVNTYRPAGPIPEESALPETPSEAELARREKLAAEGSEI